jgi:hypothetical protein
VVVTRAAIHSTRACAGSVHLNTATMLRNAQQQQDKGSAGQGNLRDLEVQREADRLRVCNKITGHQAGLDGFTANDCDASASDIGLMTSAQANAEPTRSSDDEGGLVPPTKARLRQAAFSKYDKVLTRYAQLPSVDAGRYLLDFGHVTKGLTVTKRFKVQNPGTPHRLRVHLLTILVSFSPPLHSASFLET